MHYNRGTTILAITVGTVHEAASLKSETAIFFFNKRVYYDCYCYYYY